MSEINKLPADLLNFLNDPEAKNTSNDEGFTDDQVLAESNQKQLDSARKLLEGNKKHIEQQQAKIFTRVRAGQQTSSFQRFNPKNLKRKEDALRNSDSNALKDGIDASEPVTPTVASTESLDNQAQQVERLMREVAELSGEIDVLEGQNPLEAAQRTLFDKEGINERGERKHDVENLASSLHKLVQLNYKLKLAENQIKQLLQQLLAGGTGLPLFVDPRLTFQRLFKSLKNWPKRIKPGKIPDSEAEFDAFLAWVFETPALPDEIDNALSDAETNR